MTMMLETNYKKRHGVQCKLASVSVDVDSPAASLSIAAAAAAPSSSANKATAS